MFIVVMMMTVLHTKVVAVPCYHTVSDHTTRPVKVRRDHTSQTNQILEVKRAPAKFR